MEVKLPPELESLIAEELGHKPGLDKRSFVLDAIRQHCARCKGNRERAEVAKKKRCASA